MEEKQIIVGKTSPMFRFIWLGICIFGGVLLLLGFIPNNNSAVIGITVFGSLLCILGILMYIFTDCEITVTDKRVYGKAVLGKRIDLPFDSISAVSTTSFFDRIAVASSSGSISFLGISNSHEIHKAINELLLVRQDKSNISHSTIKQETPLSNADELKKYKELLDIGAITQEEFEAKKKQLLGL